MEYPTLGNQSNRTPTICPLPVSSRLRKSFSRRQRLARDERGITLQTLIVTAVLVTIAFVAAAIIIAITNTQEESLEDQNRAETGGSTCEPWEIRDTELQAKGLGGPQGYGGFYSSAVGCVRVCYVQAVSGRATQMDNAYRLLPSDQTHEYTDTVYQLVLGFSFSDQRIRPANVPAANGFFPTWQVVSSTQVGDLPAPTTETMRSAVRNVDAAEQPLRSVLDENQEIRVHPSQEFCHAVDTANDDEEITRSDALIIGRSTHNRFFYDQ